MWRRLLHWFACLAAAGSLALPAPAQAPGAKEKAPPFEPRPPVFEYALAFIATGVVLIIVCMPSRKR